MSLLVFVAGLASIVYGCWLLAPWLAYIVFGLALTGFAVNREIPSGASE